MSLTIRVLLPLMALLLGACANAPRSPAALTSAPPAEDRRAILAMAGEYSIRFEFRETVSLANGYELKEPKLSGATEWVTVIEDAPGRISLQHVLVLGDEHHVVKHWRQDWVWQPAQTWTFEGHRRWTRRALSAAESQGQWEQSVWEVDDAPRYFGLGRWTHEDGVSSWTSAPTPRPLPRREYTTRNDYDVLMAVNRHAITPDGWVHEQDNTKVVSRDGTRRALAREIGVNTYARLPAGHYDFSAGRDYWQQTAPFWQEVRAQWSQRMNAQPELKLRESVDNRPLYEFMFDMAAQKTALDAAAIAQTLDRFIETN